MLFCLLTENQQNAHFVLMFYLIIVSTAFFEHPNVHPQEELYMQFCGISYMLKL